MRSWILLLAPLLAPNKAHGFQDAGDWPGWGGPRGDFSLPAVELLPRWSAAGPEPAWERALGSGYGGLAAEGKRVFTLLHEGDRERALCLSLDTGETLWERSNRTQGTDWDYGPGPFATPLVAGPRVHFLSGTGILQALDKQDGSLLWRRNLVQDFPGPRPKRGFGSSPVIAGDALIIPVGSPGASLVAFDPATGDVLWKRHNFGCDYATPIEVQARGITQVVAHMEEEVIGLAPRTGELLWSRPSKSERTRHVIAPLSLGQNRILVSTTHDNECLDLSGPEPVRVWKSRRICAQVGNLLYVPAEGSRPAMVLGASSALAGALLVALDAETGRVLWRERGIDCGFLWRIDDRLLSLDINGELVQARVSQDGFTVQARHRVLDEDKVWSAPAMAGPLLVLKGQDQILCLRLGPKPLK